MGSSIIISLGSKYRQNILKSFIWRTLFKWRRWKCSRALQKKRTRLPGALQGRAFAVLRSILRFLYTLQSANPSLWGPQKRSQTFPLTPRLCQQMPGPAGSFYCMLRLQTAVNSLCQDLYKCDKLTAFYIPQEAN